MTQLETHWWKHQDAGDDAAQSKLAEAVYKAACAVDEATIERQQAQLEAYCLYGSFGSWGVSSALTQLIPSDRRLARNVIANDVDALCAELMQSEPRAMFTSVGGTWDDARKAKKLTSYSDDMCEALDIDELRPQFIRDGIIAGLGILRPYIEGGEMRAERIFPTNFLVDDRTSGDVMPRCAYVRRYMSKEHLLGILDAFEFEGDELAARKRAIEDAAEPQFNHWHIDDGVRLDRTYDVVEVWEAWHLPSGKDAEDGRHVVSIRETVLVDEGYERDRFPMAFFRPVKPTRGFWGISMVKRAESAQLELNKQLRRIQKANHYHANLIVFVPRQAGITKGHMTNNVGTLVHYDGQQTPTAFAPPTMPPDAYRHRDWLEEAIHKEFAVNQMAAQGMKPAGLSSGKALRTYVDTTSRRFIIVKRAAERAHVDFVRELVACERVLSEEDKTREVLYELHGCKQRIKWKQIDLDDRKLRIKAFPTSSLPNEPAGRIEALEEMRKDGAIDQEQFWSLAAGVPDFEGIRDEVVAPTELLKRNFSMMLDDGTYRAPEPYNNLQKGLMIAARMLQKADLEGCPDARMQLLRDWMQDAKALMDRVAGEEAGGMPGADAPAMEPGAMPMDPAMMPPGMPPGAGPMPGMEPGAMPMDPAMMPPGMPPGAGPMPGLPPEMAGAVPPMPMPPGF